MLKCFSEDIMAFKNSEHSWCESKNNWSIFQYLPRKNTTVLCFNKTRIRRIWAIWKLFLEQEEEKEKKRKRSPRKNNCFWNSQKKRKGFCFHSKKLITGRTSSDHWRERFLKDQPPFIPMNEEDNDGLILNRLWSFSDSIILHLKECEFRWNFRCERFLIFF